METNNYFSEQSISEFNEYLEKIHVKYENQSFEYNQNCEDEIDNFEEITDIIKDITEASDVHLKIMECAELMISFLNENNIDKVVNVILEKMGNKKYIGVLLDNISNDHNIKKISEIILSTNNKNLFDNLKDGNTITKFSNVFSDIYMNLSVNTIINLINQNIIDKINIENSFIDACKKENMEYIKCFVDNEFINKFTLSDNIYLIGLASCDKKNSGLVEYLLNNINSMKNSETVLAECIDQCIKHDNVEAHSILINHIVKHNLDMDIKKLSGEYFDKIKSCNELLKICENINDSENIDLFKQKLDSCTMDEKIYNCLLKCVKICINNENLNMIKYILTYKNIREYSLFNEMISDLHYETCLIDNIAIESYLNSFI